MSEKSAVREGVAGWLYLQSEFGEHPLWTVGHYDPRSDKWVAESDHGSAKEAAERVHYLNGGTAS